MGRYDFRALRVRQTAKALFDSKRNQNLPQWYDVVGNIPPSETLARPVLRVPKIRHARKASKLFKPLPIAYPEDKLRSEFFGDHPWELARPRLVVEDSGNDAKGYDWSNIVQPGKQLDGESYGFDIRQLHTMSHANIPQRRPATNVAHETPLSLQSVGLRRRPPRILRTPPPLRSPVTHCQRRSSACGRLLRKGPVGDWYGARRQVLGELEEVGSQSD